MSAFNDEQEELTLLALQRHVEALYDIRNRILCPVGPTPTLEEILKIASEALWPTKET